VAAMNITSASVLVSAPASDVFNFLSDFNNMPAWAFHFCQVVEETAEGWVVQTQQGKLCLDCCRDANAGVLDMLAGPTRDQMGVFPIRVMSVPGGRSLITFTFIQAPDCADELYAIQYQSLLEELQGLAERFDGQVHAPGSAFNAPTPLAV
jgi:hypothetical protein